MFKGVYQHFKPFLIFSRVSGIYLARIKLLYSVFSMAEYTS